MFEPFETTTPDAVAGSRRFGPVFNGKRRRLVWAICAQRSLRTAAVDFAIAGTPAVRDFRARRTSVLSILCSFSPSAAESAWQLTALPFRVLPTVQLRERPSRDANGNPRTAKGICRERRFADCASVLARSSPVVELLVARFGWNDLDLGRRRPRPPELEAPTTGLTDH
jgi:hypothetical protein